MKDNYLITGGAGFIGCNAADHYLSAGKRVTILDDFSRAGSEANAGWLRQRHGDRVQVIRADVRAGDRVLQRAVEEAEVVLHLAAQVAVTTSVRNPRQDFEINALGSFNVLEAVRASRSRPIVVYSSTNKVYGGLEGLEVVRREGRYAFADHPEGVPETHPLDFHSPYGCSKGTGDQYMIDYARIYGLQTVVFRQSCIYGPHQFGIEDQGWLAWFAIRGLAGKPVTIYGDGRQVRDVLYVTDLIAAYDAAVEHIGKARGQAYNIGGGAGHTLSLLELLDLLRHKLPGLPEPRQADWRPGDQRVYVSDIRKARRDLGWAPEVGVAQGVERLVDWLAENLPGAKDAGLEVAPQ